MQCQERILVGVIAGAFGVHGEIRLTSYCSEPEAIANYAPLHSEDGRRYFSIELTGHTRKQLTARIRGVDSREHAERLRGVKLFAHRESLPDLPEDEYYHCDLVGLDAKDPSLSSLGRVVSVQNHGASDILEISRPGIDKPMLLAFNRDTVPKVDLASGYIVVNPPPGHE